MTGAIDFADWKHSAYVEIYKQETGGGVLSDPLQADSPVKYSKAMGLPNPLP